MTRTDSPHISLVAASHTAPVLTERKKVQCGHFGISEDSSTHILLEMRIAALKEMAEKTVVAQPTLARIPEYSGHLTAPTSESAPNEDATIHDSTMPLSRVRCTSPSLQLHLLVMLQQGQRVLNFRWGWKFGKAFENKRGLRCFYFTMVKISAGSGSLQ